MVSVLFILLCTVAILHCILLRQQRRYIQSSPHPVVILHITHSESYVQEKNNHDNTVVSESIPKYTSSPKESGCPFRFSHLSPVNIENASSNNGISNRMILSVYLTSHYSEHCYRTHHCSTSTFLYPGTTVN